MSLPENGYTLPVEVVVGGSLPRAGYVQPVDIVAGSGAVVIGGTVVHGTPGSVLFVDASGNLGQNNASFFWDSTQLQIQVPGTQLGGFNANPTSMYAAGTDVARIGEGRPLGAPTGTITATPGVGSLTGTYQYAYIELDCSGNYTSFSPITQVIAASNQYTLTVPQMRAGVPAKVLLRTKANGSTFYILHQFFGEHILQTGFVDNTPDGSLTQAVNNADTTKMYKIVANKNSGAGGMFMCTHPDQSSFATDLTLLMGDQISGNGCFDAYSGINSRTAFANKPAYDTRCTNPATVSWRSQYIGAMDDGTNPVVVYTLSAQGAITMTPNTTGVTNPTWLGLTGGVSGNYFVSRFGSSNSQAGLYVGTSNEPYFGGNINYSTGDTYSVSTTAPWRLGNPSGSSTMAFEIDVAAGGTAGNAISWTQALNFSTTGVATFSLPVLLSNGSLSAPSIAFSGITNTGFYKNGSNQIDFLIAGSAIFRIGNGAVVCNRYILDFNNQDCNLQRTSNGDLIFATHNQFAFATGAMATNATTGFVTIPSCAGAPTGTPANIPTGQVPKVFDTTDGKEYAYYGGAWHFTTYT